jgi:hypothetical protein
MKKVEILLAALVAASLLSVLPVAQVAGAEVCQSNYCAQSGCFSVEVHDKSFSALSIEPSGKPQHGDSAWAQCTNWLNSERVLRSRAPVVIGVPEGASLTILGGLYRMTPYVASRHSRVVCSSPGLASPIACRDF